MKHEHAVSSCGLCCTRVEHLSVQLGGREILHDINLHIHCGEITALIGPNGAGKSTLLRALLGLVPYSGKILFADAAGGPSRQPRIGYVPQHLEFDRQAPISVADLFATAIGRRPAFLGHSRRMLETAEQSLTHVGASNLLQKPLGALSGGELQRVLLALALTPRPDVLLLDEPVSGVDIKGLEQFYEQVDEIRRQDDLTVVLVSHDMGAIARHADRVVLLRGGQLLSQGKAHDVLGSPSFMETFGFGGLPQ